MAELSLYGRVYTRFLCTVGCTHVFFVTISRLFFSHKKKAIYTFIHSRTLSPNHCSRYQDHVYFSCEAKKGVLVDPRSVLLDAAQPASIMLNPIYDDSAAPASAVAAAMLADNEEKKGAGYLSVDD